MNTCWGAIARVVVVAASATVTGADWAEHRTAHDRPGTYNGGLVVRVLDDAGAPVPTRVSVSGRHNTVATESDANGRAELQGIFTRHGLVVDVVGTDDLRPHHQRVRGVSNGVVDLGLVRLERNFSITGVLLQRDTDGVLRARSDRATVELRGPRTRLTGGYGYVRAHDKDRRDGVFRIEDFDIELGLFIEIRWWSDEQRGSIVHKVAFTVDPARPHRHLLVTLPREDADDQTVEVQESVWPAEVPEEPPLLRFAGRLVTSGGRPLAGLPVEGWGWGNTVYTDEDGAFELEAPYMISDLHIPTPSGELYISSEPWLGGVDFATAPSGRSTDAEPLPPQSVVDFGQPFEATFETMRRLGLVVRGEREERIDYHWLQPTGTGSTDERHLWEPIAADLLRRVLGRTEWTLVRARVPVVSAASLTTPRRIRAWCSTSATTNPMAWSSFTRANP